MLGSDLNQPAVLRNAALDVMPTSKVQDAAKCLNIVIEPEKYGFQDPTCSGSSRVVRGSRRIYLTYCALPGKPLEIHFPRYCGPFFPPQIYEDSGS